VIGGNLDQDDLDAIGVLDPQSVKPQGSVAGPPMMGTAAAASRACPAWISRAWIQIITECPGGPGVCPETPGKPGPRKNSPGIVGRAELAVDGQAQYVAVEVAAAVQVAGPQQDPAAQNVHAAISAARGATRQG
jgi:hypothetical protein